MEEIKNPHHLIIGNKYQIEHPCYDAFDEGLEPEIEIAEIINKTNTGFIIKNDLIKYHISFMDLKSCKINKID